MSTELLNIRGKGIYNDLMRKFQKDGHEVYIIMPYQRRIGKNSELTHDKGVHLLGVKTLNVQKTNVIEKGIGQVLLEYQFRDAIKKYYNCINFDLILYSTPPITFTKVIRYVKKKNPKAKTYLMLKDIFPQNAVDLEMITKNGLKGILYKSFRKKEKDLYNVSDYIGCMSPANVKYLIEHNPEVDPRIVEVAPNSFDMTDDAVQLADVSMEVRMEVRQKFGLPTNMPIFIYGGNMGKPQGISFLIECMKAVKDREDCHFVIVGGGTEYPKLDAWVKLAKPKSVSLYTHLPKEDYDKLADACDVGMIFLDYRFTIPNYPSRLLPYIMNKKPIIAATDPICDTGSIAEENGYGFWCPSNDANAFVAIVEKILKADIKLMGVNGYNYYLNNYTVQHTYDAIMKHFK